MLSRVAESLYWTSRHIERAEDVTRLLDVNFHALLDTPAAEHRASWQQLLDIAGDGDRFRESFPEVTARSVSEFLLWHPENPNAVTACIAQARENARSVRDLIPSEVWEHVNKLYFLVRDADRTGVLGGPYEFFRRIREGSHAFLGVTSATMPRGDGFQFVQIGTHLERADKTVRIVDVKYGAVESLVDASPAAQVRLIALLIVADSGRWFQVENGCIAGPEPRPLIERRQESGIPVGAAAERIASVGEDHERRQVLVGRT